MDYKPSEYAIRRGQKYLLPTFRIPVHYRKSCKNLAFSFTAYMSFTGFNERISHSNQCRSLIQIIYCP